MIYYAVRPTRTGWGVERYNEDSGDRRIVITLHSEYAAQLRAADLTRRARVA